MTDPGIVASRNDAVSQKLAEYVHNGGTLVLGGSFSAQIRPNDLGNYMKEKWDLPWKAGFLSSLHFVSKSRSSQSTNEWTSILIQSEGCISEACGP